MLIGMSQQAATLLHLKAEFAIDSELCVKILPIMWSVYNLNDFPEVRISLHTGVQK